MQLHGTDLAGWTLHIRPSPTTARQCLTATIGIKSRRRRVGLGRIRTCCPVPWKQPASQVAMLLAKVRVVNFDMTLLSLKKVKRP